MSWIVDVSPVECPADMAGIPEPYRQAWNRYVGPVRPGEGDRERWVEQAARLEAALRILPDPVVRVAGRSFPSGVDVMQLPHYGVIPRRPQWDQLWLPCNANRYASFPVVREQLGRDVQLVACNAGAASLAVRRMIDRHSEGCLVKAVGAGEKRAPNILVDADGRFPYADPLDAGGQVQRIPFDLWTWMGGAFHLEDEPDMVLVQQVVSMRFEYRVFVIGNHPVAGAGCVERFTPIDNAGDRYDPRMEGHRHDGRIIRRADLAASYAAYAETLAERFADVITGPYVMDLYWGVDDRPHVIELNRLANAGLYSIDMTALLTAVRDHPQEFTPQPPDNVGDGESWDE